MEVMIKAGAKIETTSPAETRDIVHGAITAEADARERAHARGVKVIRLSAPGPSPAAGTLYIASGPEAGYMWAVRILSVQLASSGTCLAYIASSAPGTGATPQRLIANMSTSGTSQVATFNSGAALLNPAESIYLSATQNITAYFMAGWEVPAEMAYKLL